MSFIDVPLAASFMENRSRSAVRGLIRRATYRDLAFWARWQYQASDEDRTWDWRSIYRECAGSQGRYECYAAYAMEDLQGLAVLDLNGRQTETGRAIALDYLATNPRNRHRNSGLNQVGRALMAAAVARSMECGANGSVWLESLPRATAFYENLGMAKQRGRSGEGHYIYVLGPKPARQFLEQTKEKRILGI